MSRKRLCILTSAAAVALVGGGLWLAGGSAHRALAQDAAATTQPEREGADENGRRRDVEGDGDRDGGRDGDANPERRERRERRRDRERNREERDDVDDAGAHGQEPPAVGTGNVEERSSSSSTQPVAPAPTLAPAPARGAARTPARREDFVKQYAIVYEKNIFLRDRPTYNPNPTAAAPTTSSSAPRKPEESFVLTGIVLQEGRNVAFIEDTGTGGTQRVLSGAEVAQGKVVNVELDALEFETGGKRTRIEVGRNLAGAVVFTPPPAAPAVASGGAGQRPPGGAPPATGPGGMPGATVAPGAPAAGAAAPGGPPDPNNPNLSVEERMKLRRAQKLSGGK